MLCSHGEKYPFRFCYNHSPHRPPTTLGINRKHSNDSLAFGLNKKNSIFQVFYFAAKFPLHNCAFDRNILCRCWNTVRKIKHSVTVKWNKYKKHKSLQKSKAKQLRTQTHRHQTSPWKVRNIVCGIKGIFTFNFYLFLCRRSQNTSHSSNILYWSVLIIMVV